MRPGASDKVWDSRTRALTIGQTTTRLRMLVITLGNYLSHRHLNAAPDASDHHVCRLSPCASAIRAAGQSELHFADRALHKRRIVVCGAVDLRGDEMTGHIRPLNRFQQLKQSSRICVRVEPIVIRFRR